MIRDFGSTPLFLRSFPGPSKTVQPKDDGVSACLLPGSYIRDPKKGQSKIWPLYWESKVSISPKLAFPTISDALFRLKPTTSAIFSWGHPRRLSLRITVFRLAFCRARISEIQALTVWRITPNFSARADSVHLHSGSVAAISRAMRFLSLGLNRSPWLMLHSADSRRSATLFFS